MKLVTHLGRPIDITSASNRWVVGLTVAGAVAGLALPGDRSPVRSMIETALTVFLTWALVRELAPDQPTHASVAAVLSGAISVWSADTSLIALGGLMLAARILVRTTGLWPRLTDILAVGVMVGVFARTPLAWATGLAVAAAIALDTGLSKPAPSSHTWLAAAVGVAVTLSAVLSDALPRTWASPPLLAIAAMAAVAVAIWLAPVLPLVSTVDYGSERLEPNRLLVARRLITATLAVGVAAGGTVAAPSSYPAWVALAVVALGATLPRLFMTETVHN